jgi:hypothetical protein
MKIKLFNLIVFTHYRKYFFLLSLMFIFLAFRQSDIFHTAISSYGFLSGHFIDFYVYNNKFDLHAPYLPLIYIIFAIWNIPIYILDLVSLPEFLEYKNILWTFSSKPFETFWWKLLLVLAYFFVLNLLHLIAKEIAPKNRKTKFVSTLFGASPLVVFIVFMLSQFDIIAIFFTLLGLYSYFKKKLYKFAFFFSIAISFKYFASIIFLPLILLIEKKPIKIFQLLLIGSVVTLLQIGIYYKSLPLIFNEALNLSSKGFSGFRFYISIAMSAFYLLMCLFILLKNPKNKIEWYKYSIFIPVFCYGIMFIIIPWHAQWFIISMPFFALSYLYIKNTNLQIFLDIAAVLAYFLIIIYVWPHNADNFMLNHGVIKNFLHHNVLLMNDVLTTVFHISVSIVPFCVIFFMAYLLSPVAIFLVENFFRDKFSHRRNKINENLLFFRFFFPLMLFIFIAFFCSYVPYNLAAQINQNSYLNSLEEFPNWTIAQIQSPRINKDTNLVYSFKAKSEGLSAFALAFGEISDTKDCKFRLRLNDSKDRKILDKVLTTSLLASNHPTHFSYDKKFTSFKIPAIKNSAGDLFKLNISIINSDKDCFITLWQGYSLSNYAANLHDQNNLTSRPLMLKTYYSLN